MKLKIITANVLVFFVMGQNLIAEETSFFAQSDKQKHALVSAAIATSVTAYARNRGFSKAEAFFYGAGAAIAVGLVKEGMDGRDEDGTQSWGDVGANVLGATAGALVSAQFEWKF